jgi:hypothetical protein
LYCVPQKKKIMSVEMLPTENPEFFCFNLFVVVYHV